jgi:hypothetical protein
VAAAVATTILVVSGYRQEHVSQRDSASSAYQTQAYEQSQFYCFGKTGADLEKCLSEQTEAAQAEQRSDYDLRAQQEMSEWALGVLVFSVFSFVVSSAGLVALVWTFHEQRKLARDQARPFLEQLGAIIRFYDKAPSFFIEIFFFNSGDTPALNFFGDIVLRVGLTDSEESDGADLLSRSVTIRGGTILRNATSSVGGHVIRFDPDCVKDLLPANTGEASHGRSAALTVSGMLGYEDVFGRTHQEHVFYAVSSLTIGKHTVMSGSQPGFSPKRYKAKKK